jgi:hypothetical protein
MQTTDSIPFCGVMIVCLGLLAAGGGCHGSSSRGDEAVSSDTVGAQPQVVTGTVRHIEVEGGFYGIVTDDGADLDPVNLPPEFQKDGLRLEARVVPLRDRVSIHMWGTPVRIIEFKRL